ncbi:DNA polymerase nu-like [Helicoverpa zea]|uniref:DNA polymerase nu-like n=1 Tax=Helicoverpa zea TaxID=7113 RepID=UPI001F5A0CBD|nr:DNA polymerase nu-like [Helicoverpa zea]
MESNSYMRINIKKYEQHLSPFGNKVLTVLLKQWDKARIKNTNDHQHRQVPARPKKVLNFIDDSIVEPLFTPPLILSTPRENIHTEQETFNFKDVIEPEIPTSDQLINHVPKSKNDSVLQTIPLNTDLLHNVYNKHLCDENPLIKLNVTETTDTCKEINWDDMLDSELLDTIATTREINGNNTILDKGFPNENVIPENNSGFRESLTTVTGQKRKLKNIQPKVKKNRSDNTVKIKQQVLDKTTEACKQGNNKNNFRKQKYTKAVKNWLNNLEPPTEEIEDLDNIGKGGQLDVDNVPQKTHNTDKPILVIEKTPKTNKKVVQAQLANKDGIMKFSKPQQNALDTKKTNENVENKPKEKKVKKFVAPIKSQIPVKDISYEMHTLDEDNVDDHRGTLHEIKNFDMIAILIYSNGFCQLNSHHTDGTCAPVGIIVNSDDMFYCFKGAGQKIKEALKRLLDNNTVICYGAQNILTYLTVHLQIDSIHAKIYDAKIGASLLDPDNPPENFSDVQKLLSFSAQYTIATECTLQKAAWYMSLLKQCWAKLYTMLVEDNLWKVFVEIEMKLLPIIAGMESRGLTIDSSKLKSMEEALVNRMKAVEQQCYKAAGKVFQINSTVQVRAILYDELQLDTKCNVKIRETLCKGAKSTSETMLRSLVTEHPLPKLILEYRHIHKAHATFLAGIAQHIKDGVVRPTWVQTAAATGRIASNNPNLQAIPKAPFNCVMFPEAGDTDKEQLMFRSIYVSREGFSLLAADFKHVECRVFAQAAADAGLLQALAAHADLFNVLAAQWLKKPEAEIVLEERERTKRLVYASLYGAGTRKLMEILDVDYQQALQVAASFNRTFPSLKSFGRGVVRRCEASGGRLATLCGRVRRFANIASEDFAQKSHAERQAVNFVVQGSAADLCKLAMIMTEEQLRSCSPPVEAHLMLQIHDELVWEVNDLHVDRATAIIKQVMEGCGQQCGMTVPLPVSISVGKDWGSMQSLDN